MKRVAVVTSSRAEYGLLRNLIGKLTNSTAIDCKLVVTGTHLSPKFGETVTEIIADGFSVDYKMDIGMDSSDYQSICDSIANCLTSFSAFLSKLQPDLVVVLGDRYEILAVAVACLVSRTPLAHIHGGETTEGAFDEGVRHSITKMSQLHFVAAEPYRKRVIQLGEDPSRVFLVGGLGVDAMLNCDFMTESELEKSLNIAFQKKRLMVTFHPETLSSVSGAEQLRHLLDALLYFQEYTVVFTGANADPNGEVINILLERFCEDKPNFFFYESLGQRRYFSCLKFFDAVIGNSSSGVLEAPSFRIGTVNIGDRQKGRLRADSVIDCPLDACCIKDCIDRVLSASFRATLQGIENPYGSGGASDLIVDIIEKIEMRSLPAKRFFDLCFDKSVINDDCQSN